MVEVGRSPDSEEYVLRSGVRSGLKRELAFALKSQAEVFGLFGRTRSGKTRSDAATYRDLAARNSSSKKLKRSVADSAKIGSPGAPTEPIVIDIDGGAKDVSGSAEEMGVVIDSVDGAKEATKEAMIVLALAAGTGVVIDGVNSPKDILIDGGDAVEVNGEDSVKETVMVGEDVVKVEGDEVVKEIVIDGVGGAGMVSDETLKEVMIESDGAKNEIHVEEAPKEGVINDGDSVKAVCEDLPTERAIDGGDKTKLGGKKSLKAKWERPQLPRRFTRSALKACVTAKETETPGGDSVPLEDAPPVSGSENVCLMKIEEKEITIIDGDEAKKDDEDEPSILPEKPVRRFTRSVLKAAATDLATAGSLSGDSDLTMDEQNESSKKEVEAAETGMTGVVSPKKKLELKMSKKISLTKFPSNIRELLATGLLEGMPVKYTLRTDKLVSAFYFEQHAGSNKKHPANYIYLENGKNIHDVLNLCNNAPLDMLEETILAAVSLAPGDKSVDECKNREGNSLSTCLEAEQFYATPSKQVNGSVRDLRLHKLVFMDDILPDGTEVAYYVRGQRLLEGYIQGSGIFCRCCNNVISPSQFEAHAGYASRRKPYLNIYTSNGVSLHELSVSLMKIRKKSTKESDDLCRICADGGNLVLCDICPRAFHAGCVGLQSVPKGDWYCPYCQNMFERELTCAHNANAIAAGRVLGVDPIEQISNRCIRIVKTSDVDISSCVLCKCHDFSKTGFGDRTVILCDQCEKEYHVGCLRDHNMDDLKELPRGNWFCCLDCRRIHASLQKLLLRGSVKLSDSISSVIKIKHEAADTDGSAQFDASWRLLSGRIASPDSRSVLSKALAIFHERFDPIVDALSGRDLIPSMVYGSFVVSAGILRVMGSDIAELPLVATIKECQGQGYFQALFSCIERLLGFLGVKHFVLPAADEAESIWTNKFGFTKITQNQ
ncbi:Zinc finger CCCH domain-containing protein 19 [Acorus gramineus]|uniref:Zinc finger CCCH domain-containing protein 19 n=1 Tax=Acorus gramineus TaxID=55184 RepID=A0AAV9A8H5_ACOGR|nr:Zinc finger CCCH domain-containing protein 19 [Acorus gramineus]